jgi:primary-amine oxidase
LTRAQEEDRCTYQEVPMLRRVFALAVLTAGLASVGIAALPSKVGSERVARAAAVAAQRGPLDPLSADEIASAIRVIEADRRFPQGAFFPLVTLNEPPKSEVLAWTPGHSFRREARADVYDRDANKLFAAVVDLNARRLTSFAEQPGSQPAVFNTEYGDADAAIRADQRWVDAIRRRGINPDDVYIDVWAPGDINLPANVKPGTRLLRGLSFYQGALPNPYDRPIEGVVATVDMNRLKVVSVIDSGVKPVNKTITGNAASTRGGLKRLDVKQPDGPSFKVDGNAVTWQKWHFRVGYAMREGLVLHQIGYERPDGAVRPIINRIALDELYVPYAIPDPNWAWRAALDFGEYNLGQYIEPLEPKVDVPSNAYFFDEAAPVDTGSADGDPSFPLPHAIAMYERDGGPLWDRTDPTTFEKDARFARELVVTASYVIGNYTYMLDYVFRMDGGIDVRAGATGTTLNRGVSNPAEGDQFGSPVTQTIAAPTHQHFFNFRIDADVDGPANTVVEENTHNASPADGNAFVTDETPLTTEQFRDANPLSARHWMIESATGRNALGRPTAYALEPIDYAMPFSGPEFPPLKHAAFAQHALWVTRFADNERTSDGDYPNQDEPGDGLPRYLNGQNVDGKDLVVWYTMGFTHVPRAEDFPVMSVERLGFALRPDGFFDADPALDAP